MQHRDCDGAVERDHGTRRDTLEQLVQREDLWPVRVLRTRHFGVDRGDGRLRLVRAATRGRPNATARRGRTF